MSEKTIKDILMECDEMSEEEAINLINQAKEDLNRRLGKGEIPYDICREWFGLEPDFLDELIG